MRVQAVSGFAGATPYGKSSTSVNYLLPAIVQRHERFGVGCWKLSFAKGCKHFCSPLFRVIQSSVDEFKNDQK
jgi:hypothetical protein